MDIELRDLMDKNEQLSHIFLGCLSRDELKDIRAKYSVTDIDWRKESLKLPVEMKIGGVEVNPQKYFEMWKSQMVGLIDREAKKLVEDKLGSSKIGDMLSKLDEYGSIINSWEEDINWDVKNPLI